jgi:hypothetical protein
MAQYKVPQDVEAEDKLLGPFTFRQFVYLLIVAGMCGTAWALFQVFPLLAIIPVPVILFFGALALPLKKDQPMEVYLAAIVSFHLKPRLRKWRAGYPNSLIEITAPKIVEEVRTNGLSDREASRRLSFLANVIDTEGYSVKNPEAPNIHDEILAETLNFPDPLDIYSSTNRRINSNLRSETEIQSATVIDNFQSQLASSPEESTPSSASLGSSAEPIITDAQIQALAFNKDLTIKTIEQYVNKELSDKSMEDSANEVFIPINH